MATPLVVQIIGDDRSGQAFQKATGNLDRLRDSSRSILPTLRDLVIVGRAVKDAFDALTGGFTASIKAAQESVNNEIRLAVALGSTGKEVRKNVKELTEWAAQRQTVTTFSDDFTLSLVAMGTQLGIGTDRIKDAVMAVQDWQTQGIAPAEQGLKALAMTLKGGDAQLGRLKVTVDENATGVERFDQAVGQMKTGVSEWVAELPTAKLDQLKNAMNDFQENIGKVIAQSGTFRQVMQLLLGDATGLMGALSDPKVQVLVAQVIDSVVASIVRFVGAATEHVVTFFATAAAGVVAFANQIRAAVIGLEVFIGKGFTDAGKKAVELTTKIGFIEKKLREAGTAESPWGLLLLQARQELDDLTKGVDFNAGAWVEWGRGARNEIEKFAASIESGQQPIREALDALFARLEEMRGGAKPVDLAEVLGLSGPDALTRAEAAGGAYVQAIAQGMVDLAAAETRPAEAFASMGKQMRDALVGQFSAGMLEPIKTALGSIGTNLVQAFNPVRALIAGILNPIVGLVNRVVSAVIAQLFTMVGIQQAVHAIGLIGIAATAKTAAALGSVWGAAAVAASIATTGAALAVVPGTMAAIAGGASLTAALGAVPAEEGGLFKPQAGAGGILTVLAEREPELVTPLSQLDRLFGRGMGGMTLNISVEGGSSGERADRDLAERIAQEVERRVQSAMGGGRFRV